MSFSAMLTDTITVARATGKDSYGDPTFGTKFTVRARVENEIKTTYDSTGRERVAMQRIATTERINLQDRIWLPGENTSNVSDARTPIRVENASTPSGSFSVFMTYI